MGILRHFDSSVEYPLQPRHLVGRGPVSQLRLDHPKVSSAHAELIWDGTGWKVRDLSSRNGTFVDGEKIEPGERVPLEPGAELAFADEGCRFRLIDASAPELLAVNGEGETRTASDGLLALPDDEDPRVTLFCDHEGRWLLESEDDTRPAVDGEHLASAGGWRLFVPSPVLETRLGHEQLSCDTLEFHFVVSRDEEHIDLSLVGPGLRLQLEPRVHLVLLLQLGRLRAADVDEGFPAAEQGWVHRDDLVKMLAIAPELLSLWIHRARKQLAAAGLRDAARVVERRASATQLRLGVAAVSIQRH